GWRLGRDRRHVRHRLRRRQRRTLDSLADGVGVAGTDGRGSHALRAGRARRRLPAAHAGCYRVLARAAVHRHRVSARVLPPLPRVREILPRVGACPLSRAAAAARRAFRRVSGAGLTGTPRGLEVVAASGLAIEARIAGGLDAPALMAALEREVNRGACGIISFGIAGGLVPGMVPGTWLVGRGIVTSGAYLPCAAAWTALLRERLPGACFADIAAADAPVIDANAKRALHRAASAVAVDTGSHIAAAVAAAHGVPFAAFRVIADPAERALPAAASAALRPGGTID